MVTLRQTSQPLLKECGDLYSFGQCSEVSSISRPSKTKPSPTLYRIPDGVSNSVARIWQWYLFVVSAGYEQRLPRHPNPCCKMPDVASIVCGLCGGHTSALRLSSTIGEHHDHEVADEDIDGRHCAVNSDSCYSQQHRLLGENKTMLPLDMQLGHK